MFISSPIDNYAKQAQMKAGVSRLGQSRPTFVKHFVVEHTIEEGIYELRRVQKANMDPALSLASGDALTDLDIATCSEGSWQG